ncbi:lysozyme-like domain-containing protein [Tuber brumale]|nr:lysozyme-like domain-containing protein [Tuber brumale]
MKSISFISLFVSTLVVTTSAIPHVNSIFGRATTTTTTKDICYTEKYGKGYCQKPKYCKGTFLRGAYCGGENGNYENQCCVELVCKVPAGTGYCRAKDRGCPGGKFQPSGTGPSEWPCTGDNTQCCVPDNTSHPTSPDPDTSTTSTSTNSTSEHPGGNGRIHQEAVEIIKKLEGFRGDKYKDQVGVETIGYGHNCEAAPGTCEALHPPITEKEAEDLMMKDIEQFEKCICAMPNSEGLNSNHFSALVRYVCFFFFLHLNPTPNTT